MNNTRTAVVTLSYALRAVCNIHDTEFWHVTEWHEMKAGDSLFGKVGHVLADSQYNVQRKAVNVSYKHDVFSRENIRDIV